MPTEQREFDSFALFTDVAHVESECADETIDLTQLNADLQCSCSAKFNEESETPNRNPTSEPMKKSSVGAVEKSTKKEKEDLVLPSKGGRTKNKLLLGLIIVLALAALGLYASGISSSDIVQNSFMRSIT